MSDKEMSSSPSGRATGRPTADPRNVEELVDVLRRSVEGDLRTDSYSRMLYSTDASIYQVMPYGVLIPKSTDDVHAAVEAAAKLEVPILPRTTGSSLAGQAVNEALIVDFTRHLDRLLEVNAEEHWVRVQPGIVLDRLNLDLLPFGLQYGPDPASSNRAAMGGIVSNNSTGAHSIVYGMTADHVLEVSGYLSDGSTFRFAPVEPDELEHKMTLGGREGEVYRGISRIASENGRAIAKGTPRHWRRCGGYNLDRFVAGATYNYPVDGRFNLAKLLCGAEGTLAVMTEIKLNLVPRPKRTTLAILHFASLHEALSSVPVVLETGPSAVELLDNLGLTMCREVPQYARLLSSFVDGRPNCILITEFTGASDAELEGQVSRLERHLSSNKIPCTIVRAASAQVQANVWTVRKVGLGLLMSVKGDYKPIPFIEDAAVPVEHLDEYVTRIEDFCNELGTKVSYYAHASAGCLHVRPLINTKDAAEVEKLPKITSFAAELLGDYGGSLSSEHGAGRARSWLNERFYGRELYNLYREVKTLFDPRNILNPGNMVDAGPMTENLRYGSSYRAAEGREHVDFGDYRGFHRAVEMCNGAGVCRKQTEGTMCPSYMVTREEEHSTRGRANSLRAALSGRLPERELTSRRMFQVMDLCVECKACKAECPSSVDMTRIKFEFLARYYEKHGVPLRSRLFANISSLSRFSSGLLAPLWNALFRMRPVRWLLDVGLGISRQRTLPPFATLPFTKWFVQHQRKTSTGGPARRRVVLFNDTFNTYNTPQTAVAATEVLEAAGFDVVLPGHRCCGRPMVSKGLVQQARAAALDTIEHLFPHAQEGVPIVGLEPSCILTLRDEYRVLLPNDSRVEEIAKVCYTFEEFISILDDAGDLNGLFPKTSGPKRALLHGHCHQKALVGTGPSLRALRLAGYDVEEIDSGCCGMAGAFGYEAEHYDLSRRMAERVLIRRVNETDAATEIIAAGTSCRNQIHDFSGRHALHPAEALRRAMSDGSRGELNEG